MTGAATEVIRYRVADQVAVIEFDRPPANAYDLAFHRQFLTAVRRADGDPAVRAVVLRSALDRFFCGGADIKAFAGQSTADNREMVSAARQVLAAIESSDKPFIACLQGHALGGGLEIALACDVLLAADANYQVGLPEARLGLLPGNGGSQRLPRRVGRGRAMILLASGEPIGPREAARIGLFDQLFPAAEVAGEADKLAEAMARSAPLAVAAVKRALREGAALPLADALRLEGRLVDALYDTEDAREGFAAAMEKRAPRFTGK
jgi:enoyl-CoA hydratase/carnithine racemase